jgi:hypothetical protein
MNRLSSLGVNLAATFFMWMAVLLVDAVTGQSSSGRDAIMIIAILTAFGLTVTLWLVWALTDYSQKTPPVSEKNKRRTGEDARLSLLLELMDEGERKALKQRLMDGLDGDGEAVPLAALLAGQDGQTERPRTD